ncbi:hypothetical protein [Rhodoferax sp.]|uniref:hypothetical protein n=1 Tax=Rhodoferax sp. TaxID=50421 RepID=UPI0027192ADC|nr:hypothetical protein [Rhodoferax sp.]MDO9196323.1 hypothetical protein [Rhodoferax sp.]
MMAFSSDEYRYDPPDQLANRPPFRRLRGYAFDPSLSIRLETAAINHAVFEIPWERYLKPGPRGEYVEVIDYDPASACWYEPVDLNATNLLAQDGLAPSEGNPQFHQQMVYAVAMNTINHFEQALGRQVLWSPQTNPEAESGQRDSFVRTLRIYPHALRAANAYYSPEKKALLFGYFQGQTGTVFSCLSQDIVAHETTHALLDGMHRRYVEDNHPDTLAFHEAFADLVALFQHFTFPEVLRHQIARTRGDLETQSLLGELAQQFGEATGRYGALRNAIGEPDRDGKWKLVVPNPDRLRDATEPHERGSILVAAMFSAFLAIYKVRTKGIIALASAGSGILPQGALHPNLVDALANEATRAAHHFLSMCIRALDYCPPFDITYGDYLRALITADYDMVSNDRYGYRVALIESFRRWGIIPQGLKTLSEEQLRWPYARLEYEDSDGMQWNALAALAVELKDLISASLYLQDREKVFNHLTEARLKAHEYLRGVLEENMTLQRENFMKVTGLNMNRDAGLPGLSFRPSGLPSFEVHSVLPTLRVTPDGQIMKQLIISMTQRLKDMPIDPEIPANGTFDFRGGSTLIFDMEGESPTLRYAITRPINDAARLAAIQTYRQTRLGQGLSLRETYFGDTTALRAAEPFCMLHGEN